MKSLRKIPLEGLIEILTELFENGADYIDISGEENNNQDIIKITVRPEYFNEDVEENETSFSDEDINDLI